MTNNNNCPVCRMTIQPSKLYRIGDITVKSSVSNHNDGLMNKVDTIINIISNNPDGKFLVFSRHSSGFKELQFKLNEANITFGILTTSNKTDERLYKFRKGDIKVILLNVDNNGAGLEITEATDVILYHEMKPSLETQAIARAQRTGRNIPLNIWKLKYEHEWATV